MVMGTFWSTETNFWSIPTHKGPMRVSDTVLVHFQGSQTEYDVKKPPQSSTSCLKTAREHLVLSYRKGTLESKIALKRDLEGVITTRNGRVVSVSSSRPTQSLRVTLNSKYLARYDKKTT